MYVYDSNSDKFLSDALYDETAESPTKQATCDPVDRFDVEKFLTVMVLILRDEINILRTHAAIGLAPRTMAQVRNAFINRIKALP